MYTCVETYAVSVVTCCGVYVCEFIRACVYTYT